MAHEHEGNMINEFDAEPEERDAESVRLNDLLVDLRKLVNSLESESAEESRGNHRDSERGGYANGLDTAADRLDDLLDKYDSYVAIT